MHRPLQTLVLAAASLAASALAQDAPRDLLPTTFPPCVSTDDDGAIEVHADCYRARFDLDGATLSLPSAAALTLRLADWGRAGHAATTTPHAADRAGDELVEYRHDGIVERYRITPKGFEQSFVIAARPAGAGDLVLGIAATSELHTDTCGAAHQELVFRAADDTPAIRYGEAVAFGRGGPRVPIATRYDGGGRIELVVPEALLTTATYPLVVDPAVGPALQPGGFASNDSNSDVAFDPEHEVFCIVWQRQFGANDVRIRAIRVDRDGNTIGSTLVVTGSGFFGTPTITSVRYLGVQRFYLVWSGSNGLLGQFMDPTTGLMQGSAQLLTTVSAGTRDRRPALAYGSNQIVLAWDRTPSGVAEPQEIRVRVLTIGSGTSVTLANEQVVESTVFGYVRRPRMSRKLLFQGAALVRMVWERFYLTPSPGDTDLRTASFAVFSSLNYNQSPVSVPGASSVGVDERNHDMASIEGLLTPNYLLAWEENGDIKGLRYELNGPVGSEFAIASSGFVESEPAVGAGSTEFSVGYLRADAGNPSVTYGVEAARVLADGTVAAVDRQLFATAGWTNAAPRGSSVADVPGADMSNGVLFTWTNVSTPGGAQDDIRAQLFEPVSAQAIPYGTGCPGPNGSTPTIGTYQRAAPGNQDFAVTVSTAPANSLAALLISAQLTTTPIPGAPGCDLYAGLPLLFALPTVTNGGGGGTITLPIPIGALPGAALAFQWAIYTPGHNAFGGIVSDDVDLHWNQ
ncbi:MAG: hypothetical protein H6835_14090 [Planctomycetes bacterium]|nr:hypothetical protein [Planctomycetota bacterium]